MTAYSITPEGATEAAKEIYSAFNAWLRKLLQFNQPTEASELEGIVAAIILRHAEQSPDYAAGYEAGERDMRERAAKGLETLAAQWAGSVPMDLHESLNCKQYAKAVRSLPLTEGK